MPLAPVFVAAGSSYTVPVNATLRLIVANLGDNPGNGLLVNYSGSVTVGGVGAILNLSSVAVAAVDTIVAVEVQQPILAGQAIHAIYCGCMLYFG